MSKIKTEERIIELEEDWFNKHQNGERPTYCYRYCPLGLAPINEEPVYFLYYYDAEKHEMCFHWIKEKYPWSPFAMGKNYEDVVPEEVEKYEIYMLDWDDYGTYILHLKDYIDSHNINEVSLANHTTNVVIKKRI